MRHNWLNLLIGVLCLMAAAIVGTGCNKRIRDKQQSFKDSSTVTYGKNSFIDTSKRGTYERITFLMPVSALQGGRKSPKNSPKPSSQLNNSPAPEDEDPKIPVLFERWTNEQKGVSSNSENRSQTDLKEENLDLHTQRTSDVSWKAALVLIAVGCFMAWRFLPRNKN